MRSRPEPLTVHGGCCTAVRLHVRWEHAPSGIASKHKGRAAQILLPRLAPEFPPPLPLNAPPLNP